MPTVTDPLHPERIREQLGLLQAAVSSVAGREAALNRVRAASQLAAKRQATARREGVAATQAASQAQWTAACEAEQARIEHAYERRLARIQKAAQGAQGSLAKRVRNSKDRQVGARQAQTLRTKQESKEIWERARQDHREFTDGVVAEAEEIRALARGALKSLRSFRIWFDLILRKGKLVRSPKPDTSLDRETLRATSLQHLEAARTASEGLKRNPLAAFFRWLPLTVWLVVIAGAFGFLIFKSENRAAEFAARESTIFLALLAPVAVHLVVTLLLWPAVRRMAMSLKAARVYGEAAVAVSEARVTGLAESLKRELAEQSEGLSETLRGSDEVAQGLMQEGRRKIEAQYARLPAKAEALHQRNLAWFAARQAEGTAEIARSNAGEDEAREAELAQKMAEADAARDA
jgi:hypothetical protein